MIFPAESRDVVKVILRELSFGLSIIWGWGWGWLFFVWYFSFPQGRWKALFVSPQDRLCFAFFQQKYVFLKRIQVLLQYSNGAPPPPPFTCRNSPLWASSCLLVCIHELIGLIRLTPHPSPSRMDERGAARSIFLARRKRYK